jgi:hypothetical protein
VNAAARWWAKRPFLRRTSTMWRPAQERGTHRVQVPLQALFRCVPRGRRWTPGTMS